MVEVEARRAASARSDGAGPSGRTMGEASSSASSRLMETGSDDDSLVKQKVSEARRKSRKATRAKKKKKSTESIDRRGQELGQSQGAADHAGVRMKSGRGKSSTSKMQNLGGKHRPRTQSEFSLPHATLLRGMSMRGKLELSGGKLPKRPASSRRASLPGRSEHSDMDAGIDGGSGTVKLPFIATLAPNDYSDYDLIDRRMHPTTNFGQTPEKKSWEVAAVTCSGIGIREGVSGNPSTFRLKVALSKGSTSLPHAKGRELASYIWAYFRAGPGQPHCSVAPVESEPLSFDVTWEPILSGTYVLSVVFAGIVATGSPYRVTVLQPKVDAQLSSANISQLGDRPAGQDNAFIMFARDQHGNRMKRTRTELCPFTVKFNGPEVVDDFTIVSTSMGEYELSYNAPRAGIYRVEIAVNGENIRGSPYELNVLPGSCSAEQCQVQGAETTTAGERTTFTLFSRDAYGNQRLEGGDFFRASLQLKKKHRRTIELPIAIRDLNDGQYQCVYTPTVSGSYDLKVFHGTSSSLCKQCLATIQVVQGPTVPSKSMICEEPTIFSTVASKCLEVEVKAYDDFGNMRNMGGDVCQFMHADEDITSEVTDLKNGKYLAKLFCTRGGTYEFSVLLNGERIMHSPFRYVVEPCSVSTPLCSATGSGLRTCSAIDVATFEIISKDKYRNELKVGGLNFVVACTKSSASFDSIKDKLDEPNWSLGFSSVDIVDQGNGRYLVQYRLLEVGTYKIYVLHLGEQVQASPFTLRCVPGHVARPDTCKLIGSGQDNATAGVEAEFTIQAVDSEFNHCDHGGEDFLVTATLDMETLNTVNADIPEEVVVDIPVIDNKDGSYTVRYKTTYAGEYRLVLNHKLGPVAERLLKVKPGSTNASGCIFVGEGFTRARSGQKASFFVIAADKFGNKIRHGGADLNVEISYVKQREKKAKKKETVISVKEGILSQISQTINLIEDEESDSDGNDEGMQLEVHVSDEEDGTYLVQYTPVQKGYHRLSIAFGDGPQSNQSDIDVEAAGTDPKFCTIHGDGANLTVAGQESELIIAARDRFGNVRSLDGDTFNVYVRQKTKTIGDSLNNVDVAQIEPVGHGFYKVKYTLIRSGEHDIHVAFVRRKSNEHTVVYKGNLMVIPGKIWASRSIAAGYGLSHGKTRTTESFLLKVRDRFLNPRPLDDAKIDVTFTGPAEGAVTWTHEESEEVGTYKITYIVGQAGDYVMGITIDGEAIKGSPFKVKIKSSGSRAKAERYMGEIREYAGNSGVLWDPDTAKGWERDVLLPAHAVAAPIATRPWDGITSSFFSKSLSSPASSVEASEKKVLSFAEKEIQRINQAMRHTYRKRSTLLHWQITDMQNEIKNARATRRSSSSL